MYKRNHRVQTSESILIGSLLAVVGGYMDAYSYLCRGGVFSNAETGNIVLFAISLAERDWLHSLHYLLPVIAFALGLVIVGLFKEKRERISIMHWRQIIIIIEMIVLAVIAFMPQTFNLLVNSVLSFICGMQVIAFSKFHHHAMATTMCTGNLKVGMQSLQQYYITKDRAYYTKAMLYFGCIACFVVGAMIGALCISSFHEKAIIFTNLGLFLVLVMMFKEELSE